MRDIVDITVTQVRIYPIDCLPLAELRSPPNVRAIKEAFQFERAQADPLGLQLIFTNGIFQTEGTSIPVLSLVVDQRRLHSQVRGRSPGADAFHSALTKLIVKLRGRGGKGDMVPLVKAEDTTCIATLDVDFDELVAPKLLRFIQGDAKKRLRTDYGAPRSITFKSLSFDVKYTPASGELEEHDVVLSDKVITLEPRLGVPMKERRFYTSSPTDSETHLALLESLERKIAEARPRNK